MQTIYRNTYTTDFTVIKNDILNSELSGLAKAALIYLLSKPPHWKLRASDIRRFLKVGVNKAYRILQELRAFGYIVMKRVQSAVHWLVYDTPQSSPKTATSRAVIDRDGFHHDGNSDDLVKTETPVKIQKTTTPLPIQVNQDPLPIESPNVVVSLKKEAIPHIESKHQTTAHQALRTLTKAEADAVVTALTLAMSKGTVSNPIGYLLQLVKASKAGTFSTVKATQAEPAITLDERLAKERQRSEESVKRGQMSNEVYFKWLESTYGSGSAKNDRSESRTRGS